MRAADGLTALFGATSDEARDGAALLAFALIKFTTSGYPKAPPDDED